MNKDDWGARLKGRCPSCRSETLFRGSSGYITCSLIGCKNPGAAHDLLSTEPESELSAAAKVAELTTYAVNVNGSEFGGLIEREKALGDLDWLPTDFTASDTEWLDAYARSSQILTTFQELGDQPSDLDVLAMEIIRAERRGAEVSSPASQLDISPIKLRAEQLGGGSIADMCADRFALLAEIERLRHEIGLTHQRLDELDDPLLPLYDFVPQMIDDLHREVFAMRKRLAEVSSPARPQLEELIGAWRRTADGIEGHPMLVSNLTEQRDLLRLRQCALDLEAVLAEGAVSPARTEPRPLRELAEYIAEACNRAVAMLRREGYVFKRFPRNLVEQPPVGDGERWEAMAFSLYSDLAELDAMAVRALNAADDEAEGVVSTAPPGVEDRKTKD